MLSMSKQAHAASCVVAVQQHAFPRGFDSVVEAPLGYSKGTHKHVCMGSILHMSQRLRDGLPRKQTIWCNHLLFNQRYPFVFTFVTVNNSRRRRWQRRSELWTQRTRSIMCS